MNRVPLKLRRKALSFATIALVTSVFTLQACTTKPIYQGANRGVASIDVDAPWAFDPGPSPETAMGKELIDLVATQPNMPEISKEITGDQKFRPAFGPTLWRMIQQPNSVKILFIGQDGTHIAEAAGRTATAGFGGRAQDFAAYFGVKNSAAFINTFAFTIRGQYSAFGAPVFSQEGGQIKASTGSVTENGIWMMAQDQNSPMVKWRNGLIDWIIRNNRDSLKMVIVFGGSAQDSIATFIESRGGKVGSQYSAQDIAAKKIQIPEFKLESAGSNKEFPVIVDRYGKDLYAKLAGRRLDYKKPEDQAVVVGTYGKSQGLLQTKAQEIAREASFSNSGVEGSGVMHPAQINGYDLNKITVGDGRPTVSLKGLKLSDGSVIKNDVVVAEFPHPTALSMAEMTKRGSASITIAKAMKKIEPKIPSGWRIEADPGMKNEYAMGKPYTYGRTDIGPAYYDFGTPKNRMVSVSSASRMSGKPNIIVVGTREKATFDFKQLDAASKAPAPRDVSSSEMFNARPRSPNSRYVFDRGPSEIMAKIMKENIDMSVIGAPKKGMNPKSAGIAAFNIKTHPEEVGEFGHYRGTFNNPKVVILADPDGVDDIVTARALTGARGQYLQALMNDLGVKEQYLVIKTVPFGMDGATDAEWNTVLGQTSAYREKVFQEILRNGKPALILADGKYAANEIKSLANGIPTVTINRVGTDNSSGIKEALAEISKVSPLRASSYSGSMASIPRSHLGFFSRVWEGTSGTHVFDSTSATDKGTAFAIVAPTWSFKQKAEQSSDERRGVEQIKRQMMDQKLFKIEKETFDENSMVFDDLKFADAA